MSRARTALMAQLWLSGSACPPSSVSRGPHDSGDVDQYFSDCAVFDGLMGVCRACERESVQWQPGVLADRQRPIHQGRRDVFHGGSQCRVTDRIEQNELVSQVLDHVLPDVELDVPATIVGVDADRCSGLTTSMLSR